MKTNKRRTRTKSILKRIRKRVRASGKVWPGKPSGYHPRHLARSIAKANMQRAKFRKINVNFSSYWRKWVTKTNG